MKLPKLTAATLSMLKSKAPRSLPLKQLYNIILLAPGGAGKKTFLASLRGELIVNLDAEEDADVVSNDLTLSATSAGQAKLHYADVMHNDSGCRYFVIDMPALDQSSEMALFANKRCILQLLRVGVFRKIYVLLPSELFQPAGRFQGIRSYCAFLERLFTPAEIKQSVTFIFNESCLQRRPKTIAQRVACLRQYSSAYAQSAYDAERRLAAMMQCVMTANHLTYCPSDAESVATCHQHIVSQQVNFRFSALVKDINLLPIQPYCEIIARDGTHLRGVCLSMEQQTTHFRAQLEQCMQIGVIESADTMIASYRQERNTFQERYKTLLQTMRQYIKLFPMLAAKYPVLNVVYATSKKKRFIYTDTEISNLRRRLERASTRNERLAPTSSDNLIQNDEANESVPCCFCC